MEDFEITDLRSVRKQVDAGCGFWVGDHDYGRVDRMSDEELRSVARNVVGLVGQASRLLDAISLEAFERMCGQSEE